MTSPTTHTHTHTGQLRPEPREDTPRTDRDEAWARALDDIGVILDRYAGGPSPRYASAALLAIKAIMEEVKL
jgi:hypothetical protein